MESSSSYHDLCARAVTYQPVLLSYIRKALLVADIRKILQQLFSH